MCLSVSLWYADFEYNVDGKPKAKMIKFIVSEHSTQWIRVNFELYLLCSSCSTLAHSMGSNFRARSEFFPELQFRVGEGKPLQTSNFMWLLISPRHIVVTFFEGERQLFFDMMFDWKYNDAERVYFSFLGFFISLFWWRLSFGIW